MNVLNDLYTKCCRPKFESYKKISKNITLINDFFEDFNSARDFFIEREKWKCIPYQDNSKPGYENVFPNWVGKSLMEKYIIDNKINDDLNSYSIKCNYFYDEPTPLWSASNSSYYPHIDSFPDGEALQYICLVNLNRVPISTKFYSYKNLEQCSEDLNEDWNEYTTNLTDKLVKFYGSNIVSRSEFKQFIESQEDLEVKLVREVEYNPNQAIIYPGNAFHSPNVDDQFTEDNLRTVLRIVFFRKIEDHENSFVYN